MYELILFSAVTPSVILMSRAARTSMYNVSFSAEKLNNKIWRFAVQCELSRSEDHSAITSSHTVTRETTVFVRCEAVYSARSLPTFPRNTLTPSPWSNHQPSKHVLNRVENFLGLFFDPQDGGRTFLKDDGKWLKDSRLQILDDSALQCFNPS